MKDYDDQSSVRSQLWNTADASSNGNHDYYHQTPYFLQLRFFIARLLPSSSHGDSSSLKLHYWSDGRPGILPKTSAPCKLQQTSLSSGTQADTEQSNNYKTEGMTHLCRCDWLHNTVRLVVLHPDLSPGTVRYHCIARTAVKLCLQSMWFPSGTNTTPHGVINSTQWAVSLNASSSTTNATDNFIGLYLCNAEPTQQQHVTQRNI